MNDQIRKQTGNVGKQTKEEIENWGAGGKVQRTEMK